MNETKAREIPSALPHGELREIFPDIFMVSGGMKMAGRPVAFSRNMTVVRDNGSLTLINSMRLGEHGLKALEKLGRIENVVRLSGFHGRDDQFYKHQFDATVHAVAGQSYFAGLNPNAEPYFVADKELDAASEVPIPGARLYLFKSSTPPEAALLMLRDGGILVTGDSLQNWSAPDRYFNLTARVMMRMMGFIKPHAVGPGWKKFARPSADDLRGLFDLRFEHVLPGHGDEVIGSARQKFQRAIENAAIEASR